jgi:hypothetical protein
MDTVDFVAVFVAWYILVGGFKIFSDFTPPKYKRPMYAIQGNIGMAIVVFLFWPIAGVRLLLLEKRLTGKPIIGKLLINSLILFALFLWVRVAYLLAGKVTDAKIIQFALTFPVTWMCAWLLTKVMPQRS